MSDPWLLHNARSALHALWSATAARRVWLPAYVCGEVAAAVPRGVDLGYYELDELLDPRIDNLVARLRPGDHVLIVDYFGRPPSDALRSVAIDRRDVFWTEDRAQALDPASPPWSDWIVYSPRKVVGVPDGGIVVAGRMPLPNLRTEPLRDAASLMPTLQRFEDVEESDNAEWYAAYAASERSMRVGNAAMSRLTRELLDATSADEDRERRRANYAVLHSRLARWALLPDPHPTFTPFAFPIRAPSAGALGQALAERRIFAARHWSQLPSPASEFPQEHLLSAQLLSLPCDYRYGADEMSQIADAVVAFLETAEL